MAGRPIEAGRKLAADIGIPLRPVHIAQPLFSEGVGVRALQSTCCADLRFIVSQLNDAVRKPAPDILPSPWILDKLGEVKDFFDLVTLVAEDEEVGAILTKGGVTLGQLLRSLAHLSPELLKTNQYTTLSTKEATASGKLGQLADDMTLRAARGELDPVRSRDAEIGRVLEALGKRRKGSCVLVGPPGCGKTALAEAVAMRLAEGSVPPSLQGWKLWCLPLGSLVAGTKLRGQFEEKVQKLLAVVKQTKAILFLDEAHLAVGAGRAEGGTVDVANLLKPALARGELRCIAATTTEEFERMRGADPAFVRRFDVVAVRPPTLADAEAMLDAQRPLLEAHHGARISPAAVSAAVRLVPRRFLPDRALDLLERAAARGGDVGEGAVVAAARGEAGRRELGTGGALVGQEEARRDVEDLLAPYWLGVRADPFPLRALVLVGPPGVGKATLADALSWALFEAPARVLDAAWFETADALLAELRPLLALRAVTVLRHADRGPCAASLVGALPLAEGLCVLSGATAPPGLDALRTVQLRSLTGDELGAIARARGASDYDPVSLEHQNGHDLVQWLESRAAVRARL